MIDNGEIVKVLDFGLAIFENIDGGADGNFSTRNSLHWVGSPSYMSPEQANLFETDHRSDIFSLGIIFYELVTGFRPFTDKNGKSDNIEELRKSILKTTPKYPKAINPLITQEISELIMHMLEKEPEKRVQTVSAVLKQLNNAVFVEVPEAIPSKIGKYGIEEELRRSGMVTVYKGYDKFARRYADVHVLAMGNSSGKKAEDCFAVAVGAIAALIDKPHPHIVKYYDYDDYNNNYYIAVEHIEGQSLSSLLKKGIVPNSWELERRLKIFADILAGVAYAHEKGIAHLALSPDNIMLGADDQVKILGFGFVPLAISLTALPSCASMGPCSATSTS